MQNRPPLRVPVTPTYSLVQTLLRQSPVEFIYDRRVVDGMSFPKIAGLIRERTGQYVTHELVRRWFRIATSDGEQAQEESRAA